MNKKTQMSKKYSYDMTLGNINVHQEASLD